jgi:xanthosine utilization system XapX-like protein
MHVALWALAVTSLVGALVSLLRPRSDAAPAVVPAPSRGAA